MTFDHWLDQDWIHPRWNHDAGLRQQKHHYEVTSKACHCSIAAKQRRVETLFPAYKPKRNIGLLQKYYILLGDGYMEEEKREFTRLLELRLVVKRDVDVEQTGYD